jgi:hypothetical protein
VLALPYADPDVVALSRTGSPLRDDVALLQQLGQSEVRRLLDAEPLQTVAWPPPGPVTGSSTPCPAAERRALVVRAVRAGRPQAAEPSDRTPAPARRCRPPSSPCRPSCPTTVLSTSWPRTRADGRWQGERLAEQRWLAETAMIAAERPGESRHPASWAPGPPRRPAAGPASQRPSPTRGGCRGCAASRSPTPPPAPSGAPSCRDLRAGTRRAPGRPGRLGPGRPGPPAVVRPGRRRGAPRLRPVHRARPHPGPTRAPRTSAPGCSGRADVRRARPGGPGRRRAGACSTCSATDVAALRSR